VARLNDEACKFEAEVTYLHKVANDCQAFTLSPIGKTDFTPPSSTDETSFGKSFIVRATKTKHVQRQYFICQSL